MRQSLRSGLKEASISQFLTRFPTREGRLVRGWFVCFAGGDCGIRFSESVGDGDSDLTSLPYCPSVAVGSLELSRISRVRNLAARHWDQ